jgi:hypothetical protein
VKTDRVFTSTRQRTVVLTFATAEDAERWDAGKTWIVSGWSADGAVAISEVQ